MSTSQQPSQQNPHHQQHHQLKNFQDLLLKDDQSQQQMINGIRIPSKQQIEQGTRYERYKNLVIKTLAPITLTALTGPLTTISILLQVTKKPFVNPIDIKLQKIDPNAEVYKHVKNGIFGDNKIYKPFELRGYSDAVKQLGKEGIRGFYKGNLTGFLYLGLNAKIRSVAYNKSISIINPNGTEEDRDFIKQSISAIATCTIADILTLPLMFCQSRLTLQNSLANFRTYHNPFSILKSVSPKDLFRGVSVLFMRNIMFSLAWLQLINDSPAYSFMLSSVLSHIVTYPFTTIVRNMQVNDPKVPMMQNRQQGLKDTTKRIWNEYGVRGFYRGFIGYGIVHAFMGMIVLQQNIRAGYFEQVE